MSVNETLGDAQKGHPRRPQAKQAPEEYPLGYLDGASETRTKLGAFFSITPTPLDIAPHPWPPCIPILLP